MRFLWGSRKMLPECDKTASGVVRTSAILIAAGDNRPEVYRSLDDVPGPMRRLLTRSTEGENSGTIWIADQRGREEITRTLDASHVAKPTRPPLALVWLWMVAILSVGVLLTLLRGRL